MKYTLKKKLFTTKLLNSKGKKLDLTNSPFSIKKQANHFSLAINKQVVSPQFNSIEHSDNLTYGVTTNSEKCNINLQTGKVSSPYLKQLGNLFILANGDIVKFGKNLNVIPTNYIAVITHGDRIKYPGNTYGKIVIKNKNNKYGVMDENGKVICPCIFDNQGIWYNFSIVKDIPETTDTLQLHKVASFSSYTEGHITKLFNESGDVVFTSTKSQTVMKLEMVKNEVILSVYDKESGYSRIFTYNLATRKFIGKSLIKGYVIKYEKIKGDVYYGVTRQANNKLELVLNLLTLKTKQLPLFLKIASMEFLILEVENTQ